MNANKNPAWRISALRYRGRTEGTCVSGSSRTHGLALRRLFRGGGDDLARKDSKKIPVSRCF
jgi:hypothetical protein